MIGKVDVPVLWDLPKASVESGFSRFTLTQLVKSGRVKYIRLGAGRRGKILINAASLCEYMRGGEQA